MAMCECGCGNMLPGGLYKGRARRFLRGHNMNQSLEDKFWAKVDRSGECWIWTASGVNGYGTIAHLGRTYRAHRVSYEWANGPIPAGLHIDHLCRVRACVNPAHLEAVTQTENNRRMAAHVKRERTACRRGHEYTPENTYYNGVGNRGCKECQRITSRMRGAA